MSDRDRLDSWKEIAKHLGRDVRTVIRWEHRGGLPVHRVPGGKLPRVFAYPDELDRWLESRGAPGAKPEAPPEVAPQPSPLDAPEAVPRRWRVDSPFVRTAVFATAALAGAAGLWTFARASEPPSRLAVVGSDLLALDASGRTRWTHHFESAQAWATSARWSYIQDLDADGRVDVLAALEVGRPSASEHGGALVSLEGDGRPRWSVVPDDRLTFRDGEYGPPWAAADLAVYRVGGQARISWSVHHFTWWPGLLITLNAAGQRLGTFVNSGWIRGAVPSPDSRHLLVTGVTNSRHAYFVAVLDAAHPSGHSPEPPGSAMECLSCPPGDPLQYLVLPRTDVSRQEPFPGDGPSVMTFEDGTIQVQAIESTGPVVAAAIYEFGPDLTLRSARLSDSFWEWHRLLERDGKLDHRAEDCPERRGLEVQRWTRAEGWTSQRVAVR